MSKTLLASTIWKQQAQASQPIQKNGYAPESALNLKLEKIHFSR
jgi:hypothetical protein